MELKDKKTANQFWPTFYKKNLTIVIIIELLITAVISSTVFFLGGFNIDSLIFWSIAAGTLFTTLFSGIVIFNQASRPTKDLMAAILKTSGEITSLKPANPNQAYYQKSGLGDALMTVYKLSSDKDDLSADKKVERSDASDLPGVLDQTPCGIVAFDVNNKIFYANKAAPVGINSAGETFLSLLFNGDDNLESWMKECDENSVKNEKTWTRIPDKLPNEEDRRFFDVVASYNKGARAETVLCLVDRTKNYVVDEENLDFISFAAHELRGPITVIRGYLDVLQDELATTLQPDQKVLFHRLIVSSNRLSGYINNILNTSRYDRRHLHVYLVEDKLSNVYDIISDDMQLRAGSQNRILSVDIPKDLPTIAVDKASMSEVLGNLIDNAIKYSNEGGAINVTAKVYGDYVQVDVADHGIGMPEGVVSQLFNKFYRSHRSRETVAGTGIGLYISKAIVESHGGTISVRSAEGKGSTFTVLLPIYTTVADKIKQSDNSNENIIKEGGGWIKNHSMFRG